MKRVVDPSVFLIYATILISLLDIKISSYVAAQPSQAILLNCGYSGKAPDGDGRIWDGDIRSKFAPSSTNTQQATAANQDPSLPSVIPYMTADVFTGESTYSFPVSGGRHWVRLHFYPSSYNGLDPEDALFTVRAGDYTMLKNFSVSITAQALNQAYIIREFSIADSPGLLNITFIPEKGNNSYAFVNGIEIVSMPDLFNTTANLVGQSVTYNIDSSYTLQTMVRLNVGGQSLSPARDSDLSRTWYDDTPYIFGAASGVTISADPQRKVLYSGSVPEYIAPPEVYNTARSMGPDSSINVKFNLTWLVLVDSGFSYLVRLHFSELIYTRSNQRVFDIFINNQTAQPQFDVIAMTETQNTPIFEDYVVYVQPQSGGTNLWVALHPNPASKPQFYDAILNGLEVFKLNDSSGNLAGPNPTPAPVMPMPPVAVVARNPGGDSSKSTSKVPLIGGVTGGVLALGLVFALCCLVCHRRGTMTGQEGPSGWLPLALYGGNSHTMGSKVSGKSGTGSYVSCAPAGLCRHFTLAEIQEATNKFDESRVIGVGGFGKVYEGEIDGGTKVAVKRGNPLSEQGINEFQTEIELLSKLRHRHLVSLIGYCEDNCEMILVYDYMAYGTLRGHLYKSDMPPLSWKQRLEICIGAARGLHYLHTGAKHTIIHRDVKTTNILLDEKFVAKVSDFGLSKTGPTLDHTHVSTVVKGSFGYLDPEYFRRQQLTEKSDVYSFGVVLFEVLCARAALSPTLPREQVSLAEWALHCLRKGTLEHIIDPHLKGKINPESLQKFAETAEKCLSEQGTERPPMGDVLWNLEFTLQLQETAIENNLVDDSIGDFTETPLKFNCTKASPDNVTDSHSTGISIGGQSMTSEGSDDVTPSMVFSQLVNPKGR
jgi:serine/threonine protein kinase